MTLPLQDIRVVDLTFNVAGPFGAMILGDLGAEVVKIERPDGGDDARRMVPVESEGSAYFYAVNRNKKSVLLDIKSPSGLVRLLGLLSEADVFVTNMLPGKLRERGLDFEGLHERFPRLVYADISGYGSGGAEEDRPGYDMVLQARTGLMSVTGEPGRPPVRVGVSILDMGAGTWLALGVLAALRLRDQTGEGTRVSTSLLEVGSTYMAYDVAAFELTGEAPGRRGSGHPAFSPYGAFKTNDGYVAIGVGADRLFVRLARALDREDLLGDSGFATNADRVANRSRLQQEIERTLAENSVSHWVEHIGRAGVPIDAVNDVAGVLDDPQLEQIAGWLDVSISDRRLRQPALPIRFGGERLPVRRKPPTLGEHSSEIDP